MSQAKLDPDAPIFSARQVQRWLDEISPKTEWGGGPVLFLNRGDRVPPPAAPARPDELDPVQGMLRVSRLLAEVLAELAAAMSTHRADRASKETALAPPYPQTPQSAAEWIRANGLTVAGLAASSGVPRAVLVDLLRGKLRGHRGVSHRGAIVLGLKADGAQSATASAGAGRSMAPELVSASTRANGKALMTAAVATATCSAEGAKS